MQMQPPGLVETALAFLDSMQEDRSISMEESIQVLYKHGVLTILRSLDQAKKTLRNPNQLTQPLKAEARFVYYLWKLFNGEQIQLKELQQFINMLRENHVEDIADCLVETYQDESTVVQLLEAWQQMHHQSHQQPHHTHKQRPKATHRSRVAYDSENNTTNNTNTNNNNTTNNTNTNNNNTNNTNNNRSKRSEYSSVQGKENRCSNMGSRERGDLMEYSKIQCNYEDYASLTKDQQKQLVDRLYRHDVYQARQHLKQQQDQQQREREIQECTFQPNIHKTNNNNNNKNRSNNTSSKTLTRKAPPSTPFPCERDIKGYDKAIKRIKVGYQQHKMQRQLLQYRNMKVTRHPQQLKMNPPRFLDRHKQASEQEHFVIQFSINRKNIKIKVKEHDREQDIAMNICQIYALKQEYYDAILHIIRQERDAREEGRESRESRE